MSERVLRTQFPGKISITGRMTYVRIPKEVLDRMQLEKGDYIDITIELPLQGDYYLDRPVDKNNDP